MNSFRSRRGGTSSSSAVRLPPQRMHVATARSPCSAYSHPPVGPVGGVYVGTGAHAAYALPAPPRSVPVPGTAAAAAAAARAALRSFTTLADDVSLTSLPTPVGGVAESPQRSAVVSPIDPSTVPRAAEGALFDTEVRTIARGYLIPYGSHIQGTAVSSMHVWLCACMRVCAYVRASLSLSVYVCVSVCLSVCLSVCTAGTGAGGRAGAASAAYAAQWPR
jgi:hypothetical protein